MNPLLRLSHERIPSFRREEGVLYRAYAEAYSRAYGLRMRWLHRGVGAPAYDVAESPPMPIADFARLVDRRTKAMVAHCRRRPRFPSGPDGRHWTCSWCGRSASPVSPHPGD